MKKETEGKKCGLRRTIRIGKLPDNEFSCLVILKKSKKGMKTAELGKTDNSGMVQTLQYSK
ncbi:hypothetical protein D3Z50_17195 [Clostridiaceae bacterium]|nr:hypothetical protein [Clostridiaceae bacterium]